MTPRTFYISLLQAALAAAVLLLSHYHYAGLAAILVLGPTAITWLYGGRSWNALLTGSPSLILGLSVVMLVGLGRDPNGQAVFSVAVQIGLVVLYALWLSWFRQLRRHDQTSLLALAAQQITAITAIFLAVAFWHWPEPTAISLTWMAMFFSTLWYLRGVGERAAAILAAAWALVAAELAWILFAWQVIYVRGSALIIPQATLVLLGVGYCFMSIYTSHAQKRLSRRRLIEYVAIAGVLLAIVITGTRWNGTS